MDYRTERDSMGEIKVPVDRLYGAQTQRSVENFNIGLERMPVEIIDSLFLLKLACARANNKLKSDKMTSEKLKYIELAYENRHSLFESEFPLKVWQTGSGTQTNMNVNEVIANYGNRLAGKKLLHPNDDVNMSQSSNDVFPSALHMACVFNTELVQTFLCDLISSFKALEKKYNGVVKSGRTHLQDATPISFGQEFSGWRASL